MPPQMLDEMPVGRKRRIETVLRLRDEAAEQEQMRAEAERLHAERQAAGQRPGG